MKLSSFLLLFVVARSLAQDGVPFEATLYSVEASKEGGYASRWEKDDEETSRTNRIFIKNLPDTLATGDDWKGKIQRDGAHTLSDGTKIPQFVVYDGGSKSVFSSPVASAAAQIAEKKTGEFYAKASELFSAAANTVTSLGADNEVYLVDAGESQGTGFLLKEEGEAYFYSNIHVFRTADRANLRNSQGKVIEIPKTIELAEGFDLLRFQTSKTNGLSLGGPPRLGESIYALGNSSGRWVITKNSGEVLGVGDSTFEVSCEIVPGNSGGPIIDKEGSVIGVASFLTYGEDDSATEGTRYSQTRRFGFRLDRPFKWESVNYDTFRKEAAFINSINDSLQSVFKCWQSIDSDKAMLSFKLSEDLPSPTRPQGKLDNVVRYHNKEYANRYGTKSVKEMIGYMSTQLKEACELIISENRSSLDSDWAKAEYANSQERAARLAKEITGLRDKVRKGF